MDRSRDARKDEELTQLVGEERCRKLNNGTLKYFITFFNLVAKHSGVKINLVGSRASGCSTDSSDVDLMFCPRPTLNEKTFLYNTQCPCFFQVSSGDIDKNLEAYISENREYLSGKSLKSVPSEIFKIIAAYFKLCRKLGVSKVGFIHFLSDGADTKSSEDNRLDSLVPSVDLVPAFRISGCLESVIAWAHRERQWPDASVVESILKCEFHAVAKVSPLNGDLEKDFCLSFVVAENKLILSMTERQLSCFKILKVLKLALQNMVPVTLSRSTNTFPCSVQMQLVDDDLTRPNSESNVITSYHLKTAFLWVCEKKEASFWEDDSIIECVREVLRYLFSCLDGGYLPLYFLPAMNLFSGISREGLSQASEVVKLFLNGSVDIFEVALDCVNTERALETGDIPNNVWKSQGGIREAIQVMFRSCFNDTESLESKAERDRTSSALRDMFKECVYPLLVQNNEERFSELRSTSTNMPSLRSDDCGHIAFPSKTTTNEQPSDSEQQPQTGDSDASLCKQMFLKSIADIHDCVFSSHDSVKSIHRVKGLDDLFTSIDLLRQFRESDSTELDDVDSVIHSVSRLCQSNVLAVRSKDTGESGDDKRSRNNQDRIETIQMMFRFLQGCVSRRCDKNPTDQSMESVHHVVDAVSNIGELIKQTSSNETDRNYKNDGKNIQGQSTIHGMAWKTLQTLQKKMNTGSHDNRIVEIMNGFFDGLSMSRDASWNGREKCGISPEGCVKQNSSSENLTIVSSKMDRESTSKKLHEKLEIDIELD